MLKREVNINVNTLCYHCGDSCEGSKVTYEDKMFCCSGCKTVYELLKDNNLCDYYAITNNPGISQREILAKEKFLFLDNEELAQQVICFSHEDETHATFYLPQVHCSSCLWLLENLYKLNSSVRFSRVNFTAKEILIAYDNKKMNVRKAAELLTSIGYEPYFNFNDANKSVNPAKDNTKILKIGIAGFCFANIMMMSLPEYFSFGRNLEAIIANTLKYISLGLSIPVLFYCATEFFVSAYYGLRNKILNIDLPVSLALAVTFVRSLYDIFVLQGTGYMDSMSGIVFFMLIGRWMQEKTYKTISFDRDYKSFFPIAVNVIKNDQICSTPIDKIKKNDIIQIHHNEIVPVDSILLRGNANIDYSFVNGESIPVYIEKGQVVYAGAKQLNGIIELAVLKEVSQSYLTSLWNHDAFRKDEKKKVTEFDIIAKYFTYVVLTIAAIALGYWYDKGLPTLGWNAMTTILIVACPCALLLTTNFTNGNILRVLGLNKFYLRNAEVLSALQKIDHIVFDKTGTLTEHRKMNVSYEGKTMTDEDKKVLATVLAQSTHPLSIAICDYLNSKELYVCENFKEVSGNGIEAWLQDMHIKIGSAKYLGIESSNIMTQVYMSIDNQIIGKFNFSNVYRLGIFSLVKTLKRHFDISVISGDNDGEKENLSKIIDNPQQLMFYQSPEDKINYIHHLQQKYHKVMMIGDGLNDAGALKVSDVGISISDNVNNFSPSCDGIIDASQLKKMDIFMKYITTGKYIIYTTFIVSIIYNLIGIYYAVHGTLSPVIAAILMPSSTITILMLTFGMTQLFAKKYKLLTALKTN